VDLSTFIIAVFCLIDDRLKGERIRQRGPSLKLSDAEVLTIEIVGEFLGMDTDEGIRLFFERHYGEWFPALRLIHRTTFSRQAANLWKVKERLWQDLVALAPHDPSLALVDPMPLPACLFARAYRCRRFRGEAAFGKDTLLRQTFYGFRYICESAGRVSSPVSRWLQPMPTSFPSCRNSSRPPEGSLSVTATTGRRNKGRAGEERGRRAPRALPE
jgi:hypothetical protein